MVLGKKKFFESKVALFEILTFWKLNTSYFYYSNLFSLDYHINFSILKIEYGDGKIKKIEVARCSRILEESVSSTRSCCSSTLRIKEKRQKWISSKASKVNIQVCWSNFEAVDWILKNSGLKLLYYHIFKLDQNSLKFSQQLQSWINIFECWFLLLGSFFIFVVFLWSSE